jgi:mono/diheme cytochrome c family protein
MTIDRRFCAVAGAAAAALILVTPARAGTPVEPAATFFTKCSSCHTYGQGDLVGPDLKGATARHPRSWLLRWIRSSERMIREGDAAAVSLFRRYRQQRMPDHQLSDAQVEALLDYLAAGGPEADSRKAVRLASMAGASEVRLGRDIFFGRHSMSSSDVACSSCHTIQNPMGMVGGSLGPNLTGVYSRYQDKALSQLLERDCLSRLPAAIDRRAVTGDESFAIRAFLRSADDGRTWADGVPAAHDARSNDGR